MENQNRFKDHLPKVVYFRIKARESTSQWISEPGLNPGLNQAIEKLARCLDDPTSSIHKTFFVNWRPSTLEMPSIFPSDFTEHQSFPTGFKEHRVIKLTVRAYGPCIVDYIRKKLFETVSKFIGWYMYRHSAFDLLDLDYESITSHDCFDFEFSIPPDRKENFENMIWDVIDSIGYLNRFGKWQQDIDDAKNYSYKDLFKHYCQEKHQELKKQEKQWRYAFYCWLDKEDGNEDGQYKADFKELKEAGMKWGYFKNDRNTFLKNAYGSSPTAHRKYRDGRQARSQNTAFCVWCERHLGIKQDNIGQNRTRKDKKTAKANTSKRSRKS